METIWKKKKKKNRNSELCYLNIARTESKYNFTKKKNGKSSNKIGFTQQRQVNSLINVTLEIAEMSNYCEEWLINSKEN